MISFILNVLAEGNTTVRYLSSLPYPTLTSPLTGEVRDIILLQNEKAISFVRTDIDSPFGVFML